jgi:hypothetical protein
VVNIITRTAHYESFTESGAGYTLNDRVVRTAAEEEDLPVRERVDGGAYPSADKSRLDAPYCILYGESLME